MGKTNFVLYRMLYVGDYMGFALGERGGSNEYCR